MTRCFFSSSSTFDCFNITFHQEKLRAAGHENHIVFKEHFEDVNTLFLVMELCTGGELFDRIVARKRYSERDAAKVWIDSWGCVSHSSSCTHLRHVCTFVPFFRLLLKSSKQSTGCMNMACFTRISNLVRPTI